MNLSQKEKYQQTEQDIDLYVEAHTSPEPDYLKEVFRNTNLFTINPRMMSGHLQGRLLKMLVELTGAKKIIELGTFSGYSALAMAEGLPQDGRLTTIEINDEMEDFIRRQFATASHGKKIDLIIGDALQIIPTLTDSYDIAFIDADKRLYWQYVEALIPHLHINSLIIADNTLWDGKVLISNPSPADRQTHSIKSFNDRIAADPRFEPVMLPLRDGLTLIRLVTKL
ncbi:MAG: class I SAM-dependent methyltransferase [bacterium]|nr:class I SAM-dependent methyltransferase [Candidatus Minthenecus merdequi]